MDLNRQSKLTTTQMSNTGIDEVKQLILSTIKSNQQTFWPDISKANGGKYSFDEIQEAKKQLLLGGIIRMKEDSHEHDWEWVIA